MHAKKKIASIGMALAIAAMTTVPVMANPVTEIQTARAAQEQRYSEYINYQNNLKAFQQGEIAKAEAQKAAGKKAEAENSARIAAHQASEIAKGEAQKAAGKKAEQDNFNRVKAFQDQQKAKEAAREEVKRIVQGSIDLYLSLF